MGIPKEVLMAADNFFGDIQQSGQMGGTEITLTIVASRDGISSEPWVIRSRIHTREEVDAATNR